VTQAVAFVAADTPTARDALADLTARYPSAPP